MPPCLELESKRPRWSDKIGAYVLTFGGRVTMPSVKNFQLVATGDPAEEVVLQFGKIGNDEFTMDVRWPLSPLQGFALALASFHSKTAIE